MSDLILPWDRAPKGMPQPNLVMAPSARSFRDFARRHKLDDGQAEPLTAAQLELLLEPRILILEGAQLPSSGETLIRRLQAGTDALFDRGGWIFYAKHD